MRVRRNLSLIVLLLLVTAASAETFIGDNIDIPGFFSNGLINRTQVVGQIAIDDVQNETTATVNSNLENWNSTFNETYDAKEPSITNGTSMQFLNGSKQWTEITGTMVRPLTIGAIDEDEKNIWHIMGDVFSTGLIAGSEITDNGNGTVNIAPGEGFIKDANDTEANLYYIHWGWTNNTVIPYGENRYFYVNYNGGSPILISSTSTAPEVQTNIVIGGAHNIGGVMRIHPDSRFSGDIARRITDWMMGIVGTRVESGEEVALGNNLNFTVSAGKVWLENFVFKQTPDFNSVNDSFTAIYSNGSGGWTGVTDQHELDISHYDDGTGNLQLMTDDYYSNKWIIRDPIAGDIAVIYDTNEYSTIGEADSAIRPALPPEHHRSIFVGKIYYQKNNQPTMAVTQLKPTLVSGSTPANVAPHNSLADIQGGTFNERYHLTLYEYASIATMISYNNDFPNSTISSKTTLSEVNSSSQLTNTSQVTGLDTALSGKEPTISVGLTTQFWNGLKNFVNITTANIEGLQGTLDAQNASIATKTTLSQVNLLAQISRSQVTDQISVDDAQNATLANISNFNATYDNTTNTVNISKAT